MIKRFISALMGLSLMVFAVSPALAAGYYGSLPYGLQKKVTAEDKINKDHEQENEDSGRQTDSNPAAIRTTVGFVSQVDTSSKVFYLGNSKKNNRKVMAENALLVRLGTSPAQTISLSDLTVGSKVRIYGSKVGGSPPTITASLVIVERASSVPNPGTRTLQFNASSSSGSEADTSVSIPVSLSSASGSAVTVQYTVSGTATGGGTDYTLSNGTLTLPAGQTSGSIGFTVNNDTLAETDETVVLTLTNPTNATLGGKKIHTYTIEDNDRPTVGFSSSGSSGLESISPVTVPVILSASVPYETRVDYTVTGTATGGGIDHSLSSGTLVIPANTSTAHLSFSVFNDTIDEPDETVVITLSNPVNSSLGTTKVHTYTILDND